MKNVVLVDGSSYLFRAYHALPFLISKQGDPTGAILGVINMLRRLPIKYKTDYVAVIFDAKGKSFRNDIYAEYKTNRKPMDNELKVQIQPLFDIINKMGFPLIVVDSVEADDVIGTLAKNLEEENCRVVISTSDKDMAQLVNEKVVLFDSMKNVTLDVAGIIKKYEVRPDQIIDYLALMGDSSDNIPGIPNVGPKTAVKWLKEYGSIENIITNQDDIKGKVGEKLRDNIEQLKLSYTLATIKCDLELELSFDDLKCKKPDDEYLAKIFTHYGFSNLLKGLERSFSSKVENLMTTSIEIVHLIKKIDVNYKTISTIKELEILVTELDEAKIFAFDIETDSLDIAKANLVGLSFCMKEGVAYYIPVQHRYLGVFQQLEINVVLNALRPIFHNTRNVKVAHNFKFDEKVLSKYNIEIYGDINDTMIMSYVLKSNGKHSIDTVSEEYLKIKPISYVEMTGTGKKQKTLDQIEIGIVSKYASENADITFRLFNYLSGLLAKEEELNELYYEVEMPLTLILNYMEKLGVRIDANKLKNQSLELEHKIAELEVKCFKLCGEEFNLSSPLQLRKVLFERMDLPIIRKTSKGQASTSEDVLMQLAVDYEVAALIMQYRHLSKLKNTYIDKLPKILDINSRVHTSYNQTTTVTGRLSSTGPNLQNIPIKSIEGRRIREAFIAEDGFVVVAVDYSQIELRIMAHLSKDKNLMRAFNDGLDIHSATAAEVLGVSLNEVTSEQRRRAKAINFGLMYGMSAFGLAKQLKISRSEAQDYINVYFERYPFVKKYMTVIKKFAKEKGYVKTILGRRLYLPEINAKNGTQRAAAERAAINAPMQGTAADIIKKAMINMDVIIQGKYFNNIKMIMQVHDELVFEVDKDKLEELSAVIRKIMEEAIIMSVPLEVNIDSGDNWDQAH